MSEGFDEHVLTQLAQKGSWYVDCDFNDGSDSVVYTGDGVDDLDQLLRTIDLHPKITLLLEIGQVNNISRRAMREDIVALRAAYVVAWGETPKPPVWIGGLHARL